MHFHKIHGKNISFDDQRLVATRFNSFTHGMIFSERPLHPGELFLVEINDISHRWTGHMKIGLTFLSPNEVLDRCKDDVNYDDIFHIAIPNRPLTQCICTCGLYRPLFNINSLDDYIHTPFASIRRETIEPVKHRGTHTNENMCPTSIGSRIGVIYVYRHNSIHMHCVLNGFDYGPFAILNIQPSSVENDNDFMLVKKRQRTCIEDSNRIDRNTKFWAFVDVYGGTKQVRVLQIYGPQTLKSQCRSIILFNLKSNNQINHLPFGEQLKSYLKFSTI